MPHHAFTAHQRARFLLPDALKFLRPDAAKFLKPGIDPADVYPALAPRRDAIRRAEAEAFDEAIAHERALLGDLRSDLAHIKSDLAWRRLRDAVARKYSPNQPRVPAGSGRESGRWTSEGDGSSGPVAQDVGTGETLDEIVVDGSDTNSDFDGPAGDSDTSASGGDVAWADPISGSNDSTSDRDRPTRINDTRVVSDADPESFKPGERYAQARGGSRGGGNGPITPGQAVRLEIARARANDAIRRAREIDPSWSPRPSFEDTIKGRIGRYEAEALEAQQRIDQLTGIIGPGNYASRSIPNPQGREINAAEQRQLNEIMANTGCHRCGTHVSGTRSGNAIGDHQMPTALNPTGHKQRLFPHCAACSSAQGGFVSGILKRLR